MNCTIGFIGAGNMATAIMGGIMKSGNLISGEIGTFNVREESKEKMKKQGFVVFDSIEELAKSCQYVVLSVKPQKFPEVLPKLRGNIGENTVLISIAAGISAAYLKENLECDCKIVLAMPNTPLLVGCGTTAISCVEPTTKEEFAFVKSIFAGAGMVEEIAADKMNEVIPFNGSNPAFIYYLTQLYVEQAVQLGFDEDTANRLFCNTLIGSAKMMLETGKSHQELIDMVTSPGGTTLKGLEALRRNHLDKAVKESVADCIARAYELGK